MSNSHLGKNWLQLVSLEDMGLLQKNKHHLIYNNNMKPFYLKKKKLKLFIKRNTE